MRHVSEEFPEEIASNSKAPWNDALFKVDDDSPFPNEQKSEAFRTFVVKGMFLFKRTRPCLEPGLGFLSSRAKAQTKQGWSKLVKVMSFMISTLNEVLMLSADDIRNSRWHAGTAFRVCGREKSRRWKT